MSIKSLAALAVKAEEKKKQLEAGINRERNADIAVKAVYSELGLQGEALRAESGNPTEELAKQQEQLGRDVPLRPYGWGHLTVVEVDDGETSLTIMVQRAAADGPRRGLYGPMQWKFTVTHINGTDLTGPGARYKSAPDKLVANVRFLASKPYYDSSPYLNEVRSLADVGRLLTAWEAFQAQKLEAFQVQTGRVSG